MKETKEELEKKLAVKQQEVDSLRKQLEAINEPKSIIEQIGDYNDVLRLNKADESKDVISIDKFDAGEHEFLRNVARKMRICKAYGQGKRFTRNDRRYHNWYDISSGFVLDGTIYADAFAATSSASRLCFDSPETSIDAFKKFPEVEEGFMLG